MANELTQYQDLGGNAESFPENLPGAVETRRPVASGRPVSGSRKAEIEQIMNTDFARYEQEGLNREYLAILECEMLQVDPDAGTPTRPMLANESRNQLANTPAGMKLVMSWERLGGFATHLANAQKSAGEIVRSIGSNRAQRVFLEHLNRGLPEGARMALYNELSAGANMYAGRATQSEIYTFAKTGAGAVLVPEWGTQAAEKLSIIRKRAARLTENMSEDDSHEFWFWFEELDSDIVTTIIRKMAGG